MKKMNLVKVIKGGQIYNGMTVRQRNGKETKTTIFNVSKNVENVLLKECSDTGNAYLMKVSARLTVSALLKLFANSGNDFEYGLYRDSVSMFRESLTGDITSFLDKWSVFEDDIENRYPNMNDHMTVNHEYSMIELGGQKKRIFDIWSETVETEKGKEKDSFHVSINHDVYDLYMECYKALSTLVNFGIISEYSDLWEYRQFGYQAITKAVRQNRKYQYSKNIDIETDSYMEINHDESDDVSINIDTFTTKFFTHSFSTIENESVKSSILDFLSENLETRKNRDISKIVEMFRLNVFNNEKVENIGKQFSISHVMVLKNIATCKELLTSPYGLKYLKDSEIISESSYQKLLELDKAVNS